MINRILDIVSNIFTTSDKKLEMKMRQLARQTTRDFDNLQKIIKEGEYVMADHQKVVEDRDRFFADNEQIQIDQNVGVNTDNKRAYTLLTGVMLIGCILSVKGLTFFFNVFYASSSVILIIPIAMALAGVIVVGSIYLNNFANHYQNKNIFAYFQLKAVSYVLVLFIPVMNLMEVASSEHKPIEVALNIFACIIDVLIHTSLVSMSSVFILAENSKRAIKDIKLKEQSIAKADDKLRAFNDKFIHAKTAFTSTAKEFVSRFKELQSINSSLAYNVLLLLDNFTIWMLNNKVMQHALIDYHTDENGHPVVELGYFTAEQDSIRNGWDLLSAVRLNTTNIQNDALNNQIREVNFPKGYDTNQQEQIPIENMNIHESSNEEFASHPDDYDSIIDSINPNDKIL